ncbi:MAG: hypothetical protein ABSB89_07800 [Candidatus Bathyarchaeia archaeon]|jgi:hypothetical protein
MSGPQTSGNKPNKMVSRKVVYSLGLACIVLTALVAYFAVTSISQDSYTNLQNQNKQLQTWLSGNETLLNLTQADNANLAEQIANQNNTISQLESNIASLENQIANDNATITSLENSITPSVWIASVSKFEVWSSTYLYFDFTVNVTNNGTDTVNNITVVIVPHPPPNASSPLNITLDFGTIVAEANETKHTGEFVDDVVGGAALINSAVLTLYVANIPINQQTLQGFIEPQYTENRQTWVFS